MIILYTSNDPNVSEVLGDRLMTLKDGTIVSHADTRYLIKYQP
jgi:ABC-type glutathione transport system ATPase component